VKRSLLVVIALIIVGALLISSMAYTVRFTQAGVVTFLGKAGEGAVKKEPGLYFKAPFPFGDVTLYDTRARVVQLRGETQQTLDNKPIVVETFAIYRVDDPLKFFQRFSNRGARAEDHFKAAEETVRSNLRASAAAVSGFRMDELLASGTQASKLPALEQRILSALRTTSGQGGQVSLADYGIVVVDAGVSRLVLPEQVTSAVFDRMRATRDRLAQEIESQGLSQASAIRAQAEADARRITAFAERLAQDIRTRGDLEAAPFLRQMNQNPELAVFMGNIDFMKSLSTRQLTLVLSSDMPGLDLMNPAALNGLRPGQLPATNLPANWLDDVLRAPVRPADEGQPTPRNARPEGTR
jgi:membrane protease subunit HflC